MEKKITGHTIFMNQCLGEGSYGTVYVGLCTKSKQKCAVKIISRSQIDDDEYAKKALLSEIDVMKSIQSPNIVQFIDTVQSNKNYYIIQELCEGDLEGLMKKKKVLPEDQALNVIKDIFSGFVVLLKEGIIHRDLKLGNIMHAKGKYKIGDFGLAKKNKHMNMKNSSLVGTPLYMSPEILKSQSYTSKCDIWSLGIIFYELLHGETPWQAQTECELLSKIESFPPKFKVKCSKVVQDFITSCLKVKQKERISWESVFVHPVFGNHFKDTVKQNQILQCKLKKIMTDIRYIVNSQNIDVKNLISMVGLKESESMDQIAFKKFLLTINPQISDEEYKFCFAKLDINGDGYVSTKELMQEMQKNNISMESTNRGLPTLSGLRSNHTKQQNFDEINDPQVTEIQEKIRKSFEKLHKTLTKRNLTLFNIFETFDLDKSGFLTEQQLYGIMIKLDKSFDKQETKGIFKVIDVDNSQTIDFLQLNSYYSKLVGIPETMFLPEEMKEKLLEKYKK